MALNSRRFFLEFFQRPTVSGDGTTVAPVDPSTSWAMGDQVLAGLNLSVRPPEYLTDRLKERPGRVIRQDTRWDANRAVYEVAPVVYAIFCANIIDTEPPPYPGCQPVDFQKFRNPVYTFTDGTKGRWEPTRYPQLFDSRRPWLGLFRAPALVTINDPIHYQNVLYFWVWNSGSDPLQGGWWKPREIKSLFRERRRIEDEAKRSIKMHARTVDFEAYTLPYSNDLEESKALKWTTFREGRDALAHTLSYIAEVEAFVKWMGKMVEFKALKATDDQFLNSTCLEGDPTLAGTWAPTISSTEEWEFLLYCRIPIYMILEVPESHSLYAKAVPGNLDNDERFRRNAFDHSLGRENNRRQLMEWEWAQCELSLESRPEDLPESITIPSNKTSDTIHPTGSWRSPIYRDPDVVRTTNPLPREEEFQRYRERVHFTSLPPHARILSAALDQHPLLYVIPEERSVGITYYEEMKDPIKPWYWPKRLEKFPLEDQENFLYRFDYELERICIVSRYSFPGRAPLLCRTRIDENFHNDPSDPIHELPIPTSRDYYRHQPIDGNDHPEYEWTSEVDILMAPFDPPQGILRHIPYVINSPAVETYTTPIADLRQGRRVLDARTTRPICSPKHREHNATRITSWNVPVAPLAHLPEGHWSGHFCYPMRLANISGHVSVKEILDLMKVHCISDLVLYAFYRERDTTCTLDVGLRYAEDALLMFGRLHGYLCHGRYMEVYPLKSIYGPVSLKPTFNSPRPIKSRLEVLEQATDLYREFFSSFEPVGGGPTPLGWDLVELKRRLDMLMLDEPDQASAQIETKVPSAYSYSGWEFEVPQHVRIALDPSINLASFQASILKAPALWVNLLNLKWPPKDDIRRFKMPRTGLDHTHPHGGAVSTSLQAFKKDLREQAIEMQSGWETVFLSYFDAPGKDHIQCLKAFWDWQDECLEQMRHRRNINTVSYDYSSFEDTFGSLNRLHRIPAHERPRFALHLGEHYRAKM